MNAINYYEDAFTKIFQDDFYSEVAKELGIEDLSEEQKAKAYMARKRAQSSFVRLKKFSIPASINEVYQTAWLVAQKRIAKKKGIANEQAKQKTRKDKTLHLR